MRSEAGFTMTLVHKQGGANESHRKQSEPHQHVTSMSPALKDTIENNHRGHHIIEHVSEIYMLLKLTLDSYTM